MERPNITQLNAEYDRRLKLPFHNEESFMAEPGKRLARWQAVELALWAINWQSPIETQLDPVMQDSFDGAL